MGASETWFGQLETNVFAKFKQLMLEHENSVVNGANYTSESQSVSEIELPTVYLHEVKPKEVGFTLENDGVQAVICSIRIDVYANNKSDCGLLARVATAKMKSMRFNVEDLSVILKDGADIYHSITLFSRLIGAGDVSSGLITES